jgi:hypothetical protein
VRIQRSGSSIILRAVELDGAGGYAPGKIDKEVNKELSPAELETVVAKLDKTGFWQMEPREDPSRIGLDGATWILEGSRNGKYQVVDRWSPQSGDFRDACLFFLQLSNLMTPADRIY